MAIAFIPLRGGSKSIPMKNVQIFHGKPLCYWSVKALQDTDEVSSIIVATDSDLIKNTVSSFGLSKVVVYNRDPANAQDTSSTESVIIEYLNANMLEPEEKFLLVQATNPFTESHHLSEALKLIDKGYDSLLTCVRFKRFLWSDEGKSINYDFYKRPRRQDFKGELLENGAFYISTVRAIKNTGCRISGKIAIYEMPEYTSFEIDEPDDWVIMENLFSRHHSSIRFENDLRKEKKIKLFLSDVDGVLTDAGMYYTENGDELKKFNTHDGMAFKILKDKGILTGLVTSELTKIVENRATKLRVDFLYQGKGYKGKLDAALEICNNSNISLDEVAYIGDDINCIELLKAVGLKACPANAVDEVKNIPNIIQLNKQGGEGAIREFVDKYINNK